MSLRSQHLQFSEIGEISDNAVISKNAYTRQNVHLGKSRDKIPGHVLYNPFMFFINGGANDQKKRSSWLCDSKVGWPLSERKTGWEKHYVGLHLALQRGLRRDLEGQQRLV